MMSGIRSCLKKKKQPLNFSSNLRRHTNMSNIAISSFPRPGDVWRHSKTGNKYVIAHYGILQTKVSALDLMNCVVYFSKDERDLKNPKFWIRPLIDFSESIDDSGTPRFVKISSEQDFKADDRHVNNTSQESQQNPIANNSLKSFQEEDSVQDNLKQYEKNEDLLEKEWQKIEL